jgi:hypothetical protein
MSTGSMARLYGTTVRDKLELLTTWPVGGVTTSLGDVGFLSRRGKLFQRRTNLGKFGVTFKVKTSAGISDHEIKLGRDLQIRFKASGNAPPLGSLLSPTDVGFAISLGRGSSVIVRAHTIESSIEDLQQLETDLIRISSNAASGWKRKFVVVTSVFQSNGTTVILANGKETNIDIIARAGVTAPIDLADVNAGLSIVSNSSDLISVLAQAGFVPFLKVHRIKGGYWNPLRLELFG